MYILRKKCTGRLGFEPVIYCLPVERSLPYWRMGQRGEESLETVQIKVHNGTFGVKMLIEINNSKHYEKFYVIIYLSLFSYYHDSVWYHKHLLK